MKVDDYDDGLKMRPNFFAPTLVHAMRACHSNDLSMKCLFQRASLHVDE